MAGFISEWRPTSIRNGGRIQIGIPGRIASEFAIYLGGLSGNLPNLPVSFAELAAKANAALSPSLLSYVAGGCGDEQTQNVNVTAFQHWGMIPRMMVGASQRDLSIQLFGMSLPTPIFMAPIGVVGLCAQDGHGDIATAKAAARTGVPMVASTLSVDPLEIVANEFEGVPGFFQLYTPTDRELAASLVQRAEAAGFKGIVVTLDTWVTGWRPRDLAQSNFPQLRGRCLANYFSDPRFCAMLTKSPAKDPRAAALRWAEIFGNPLTWDDLPWLRGLTRLPLILKGICHPDDARRAIDGGVDAIYCSNHGGRQANGGIAAIDMLPAVAKAAGMVPVLFELGHSYGNRYHQGTGARRNRRRHRTPLRLWRRSGRRRRDRSRLALPACRGGSSNGGQRLSPD